MRCSVAINLLISCVFINCTLNTTAHERNVFNQAISEGATVLHPVKDQFYGDRSGYLKDPFGHLWSIATHKKDLSPDELRKAGEAFFEEMSKAKAA
jgi:hypothetical protein